MDGAKPFTIMMRDTEVMRVDFDALQYEVLCEKYLPYPLKGRLREIPKPSEIKTAYDMTQMVVAARKNEEAVVSFLANRVLLLSRANAKWIYNLCHFEQAGTDEQKVKIAMAPLSLLTISSVLSAMPRLSSVRITRPRQ